MYQLLSREHGLVPGGWSSRVLPLQRDDPKAWNALREDDSVPVSNPLLLPLVEGAQIQVGLSSGLLGIP